MLEAPPGQRTSNATTAGDSISDPNDVDTHTNETSGEKHWLDGGLTSSFPPVEDLEGSDVPTNSADEGVPGRKPYTSSLYTDAFNLALNTVLAEEFHLFSEQETEIFQKYRLLPYEAQYLYVRLFLRKSATWFRLNKLGYHSDILDINAACSVLWSPQVGLADHYDAIDTLDEAVSLLTLEELKLIGKDEKFTGCTTKSQLISALKKAATSQGRLRGGGQLSISFDGNGAKYIKKILEITASGPCIRLHPTAATLFNRVHLVFYRSTEYSDDSLKTLILARTSKRNFPKYIVSRTANIFPSHEVLVEFEESIKLQAQVDGILEGNGVPTKDGLQQVLDIAEGVYLHWLELVQQERNKVKSMTDKGFALDTPSSGNENEILIERIYLRRFSPAWVLTRIVHKYLHPLARFKMYLREHEVLSQLLSQRFYHTARRGAWYQRKALIEERYMAAISPSPSNLSETERKKKWLKIALDTCCKGLQDPLTHIIFHYDLQKRITKLEQKLKIPKREQHDFGYARLLKPTERTIFGTRIQREPTPTSPTNLGRKTVWLDPDLAANKSECSVEEMCLSHYRSLGWKGYHCEGSLLRTLFAYLFYDILFLYVPNVFETEYQTCPLDLVTDAFYPARASEINHRLVEIGNGGAKMLVREVWERERERETCVVGLDWRYEITDLEEIVECIPGEVLAVMCKVMCQEYQQRGGGMPDLFLWNFERKELKSDNDRLSDTQRLWIHVLSSAGIKVELCHALAKERKPGDELQEEETQ
ncbi:coiled-coil domain-containing protein MTMR15 [Terfezia boudieri ATCC MYA-4762]|uniref:Fanconi-associated nuclease n=1 Tax=Terfezia boudieri ATCC MYA-4762 TaxID=1051890 RepID=A0A3N4LGR9_9PEZI|nr:coiled-coil domain-containing protein MTMR15 [Terfezia boudieri ATCC MYA-4762]